MVRLYLSFAALCSAAWLHAQRFSIEAHGTYQLPIGGSTEHEETWQDLNDTTRVGEFDRVNINWGTGFGAGLGLRMGINDRLQVELRATFFPGSTTAWKSTYRGGWTEYSISSRFLRLEPAVRLHSGEGRFSWHLVAGPSLALAPRSVTNWHTTITLWGIETNETEHTEEGGIGLGGFAGAGVEYAPFGSWSFIAELTATAQSWSPRRAEVTKYEENGVDQLPEYPTYSIETEYVDSYRTDEINADEPRKALRFHYPMSSWGIRFGVCYTFHRRTTEVAPEETEQ